MLTIASLPEIARENISAVVGKDVLLFAIPPDCFRGIVIGYRAKPESVARLREIVARNPSLSHVQFERAAMRADGQIELLSDDKL
jgi:hypothetical protein